MAQLKDTLIQGSARVTDTLYTATLKPQIIEGGQITAPLSWKDGTALPEKDSSAEYFLAIDAFASGGKTYWVSKANTIVALGINKYLPLAGGTMTGALNFANNTWNKVGDDVRMGDINSAGTLAIQGLNGNTRLLFTTYNQTTNSTGGSLTWDGSKFVTSHAITRTGVASNWHKGRDNSLVAISTKNGYSPLASMKTTNGSWEIGTYDNAAFTDDLLFSYITDTTYSGTTAKTDAQIRFYESGGALFTGQTTVEYNPNATDSAAKGMINLTSSAPATVVKSGTYSWGINHLVPNLASGGNTCLMTGVSNGSNNQAVLEFHYHGSNNAENAVGLGLYGNNGLLTINKAGTVKIKATTASTSSTTGALVVGGGIATSAASYLTGSVHIIGSAGSNALVVRGISGCDANGNRGDPATNPDNAALYFNLNNGPIYLGGVSATETDAVYVQYTQDSTDYNNGAIRIGGGLGVAKQIHTNSHIVAGRTTSGKEIDVKAQSNAGDIYLYSAGTDTGNRGIWLHNHGSTKSNALFTINQDNAITTMAPLVGNYVLDVRGYGYWGSTSRYIKDIVLRNNALNRVAETWYDVGDATNVTTGIWNWRQYSPNNPATTTTTGYYETYYLPTVATGLTANKNYRIITEKNLTEITKVGTITAGTWHGSAIAASYIGDLSGTYKTLGTSQFYGSENASQFFSSRVKDGGGGWAWTVFDAYKNDKTSILSNFGNFGSANSLSYCYIGVTDNAKSYNSEGNVRLHAPTGTTLATGVRISVPKLTIGQHTAQTDGSVLFINGATTIQTGGLWVQGGSAAGGNHIRMALTSGMPDKLPYNSNKRGVFIYSNAIAFADPLNGNGNNDAGWIRHLEETANAGLLEIAVGDDGNNEQIVVRRYNSRNAVAKEIKLFDTSGNSTFPGSVTATNGFVGNLTGAASKLGTTTVGSECRGIYLNAGTPTALTWYHNYVTVNSGNTNNYPWHRVATTNLGTGSYVDRDAILFIHSRYSGGKYGVIKISARANNASADPPAATSVSATWIVRYGFAVGDVRIARKGASGQSAQCDVYIKCSTYMRTYAYLLEGANYNWTLLASNETNNTTADDKKTSIEVYPDVTTSIGAIAYDNVTVAVDGGTVNHANSSDTTTTASNLTNFKVTTSTNLGIDGNGPGTNALGYVSGLTKAAWNYQQTDGALISQWYNNSWITEIFQDYRTGQLSVRGKNGTSWQPWRRILDETNGATILGLSNYRSNLAPASGAWFRGTPLIGSDGVMEIGKYLDFHAVNTGTADYSARITATTTGLLIDGADNSSTTTQTGKLVLKSSGSNAVSLEFYRNSSASWQILNTSGALQFNTNYTTAAQTTYSKNAISIDYNTLGTTFNGHVIITGTVSGSDTGATAAYNESLGGPKLIFDDGGQKAYLLGDRYNTSADSLFDFTLGLITSESRGAAFRTNGIKATSRLAVNSNFNSSYNLTVAGPSYFNGTIDIKPDGSGEGGELHLCAAANATTKAGIVLDNLNSNFRIFGIASADGTTKKGVGTALVIDPYAKTITGGYTITGTLDGNATSANTATTATQLSQNTRMDYGWNGLQYFNLSTARSSSGAAKVNETPYTSATWTHIIRCNHANNAGYYTDLAIPFNANGIYYKRVAGGALQNGTTNGGWVNVLDQLNFSSYAIPKSIGTQPGDIIYWSAANTPTRLGKGAAGKFLKMGGSNVPEWGDGSTVSLNGTATTSASFYAPTSAGTNGYYLKSNGSGAPTWAQITTTDKYVNVKVATSPAWTAYLLGTPTQPSGSAEQTSIIPCASANAYISSAGALTAAGVTSNGNITVAANHKIILNGPTTGTTTNAEIARVNSGSQAKLTLGVSSVYTDIGANVLMGAAWNDYAEYRCTTELEAGRCVQENDNGIMTRTEKRLIPGASVVSDTYGFAQGETATAKTPVAVAGRVLVYTYQDRTNYHAGMAVCAAPDGTIDIMTREEIVTYPDCIIGYVSEVPEYSIWGEKAVPVNNRIWIKVK